MAYGTLKSDIDNMPLTMGSTTRACNYPHMQQSQFCREGIDIPHVGENLSTARCIHILVRYMRKNGI